MERGGRIREEAVEKRERERRRESERGGIEMVGRGWKKEEMGKNRERKRRKWKRIV